MVLQDGIGVTISWTNYILFTNSSCELYAIILQFQSKIMLPRLRALNGYAIQDEESNLNLDTVLIRHPFCS